MDRMQDENTGIPVRTVNKFRAKVPSVFTGKFNIPIIIFPIQKRSVQCAYVHNNMQVYLYCMRFIFFRKRFDIMDNEEYGR